MADPVIILATGFPAVEASLKRLSGIDAQRIRERTITAGARMTVPFVKSETPIRTGTLFNRTGSFTSRSRTSGGFIVGRDTNSRIVGSTAPHRHLVTRGTAPRSTRNGAYRGIMPSNPYIDRAWRAARYTVVAAMTTYAGRELKKLWHV